MSLVRSLYDIGLGVLAEAAVNGAAVAISGHQNTWGLLEREGAADRLRRWRAGDRLPVLFCHGYMGDRSNFVVLAARLRLLGWRSQASAWLLPYWLGCEEYARRIERAVGRILARTGAPGLDIVAHSMGGVAARRYLALAGPGARVRRVVTLGTPHAGTPSAYASPLPFDRSAIDIRPGSEFLKALGNGADLAALPSGTIVSIRSNGDQVVPHRSSIVPAPQENVFVPGIGHGTLLISRRVARAVVEALGHP